MKGVINAWNNSALKKYENNNPIRNRSMLGRAQCLEVIDMRGFTVFSKLVITLKKN